MNTTTTADGSATPQVATPNVEASLGVTASSLGVALGVRGDKTRGRAVASKSPRGL